MSPSIRYLLLLILALFAGCKSHTPSPSNSTNSQADHLKDLGWLVGNWQDDSDQIDVYSTFTWQLNHKVLFQTFKVELPGENPMEGQEWIIWDPAAQSIRSWIVDSDGGFGESTWSEQGDSWYVSLAFTLADGRKASATHIYTKVDSDSYTFASVNRDIAGTVMPNIGPFKVVRKR